MRSQAAADAALSDNSGRVYEWIKGRMMLGAGNIPATRSGAECHGGNLQDGEPR